MSREELLDFARWACPHIEFLQGQYDLSENDRINKEVLSHVVSKKSFWTRLVNNLSL